MKANVQKTLQKALKEIGFKDKIDLPSLIETPKDNTKGDFALPCFSLTKALKQSPVHIAEELTKAIDTTHFKKVNQEGPYINFFINRAELATNLIKEIEKEADNFGKANVGKKKSVMIEFPSPNTNKPLHLGHLRNMSIGESLSRIYEANGFKTIRASINNDRGIHICKSMLAYQKFGKNKTPKSENKKSDHFVGDFYVQYNQEEKKNKAIEKEVQEMLKKYEEGDKETIKLWKQMNKWAFEGFHKTYKTFGIKLDKEYFESEIYKHGKEIILEGLKKGIFEKREDGAIFINLEKEGFGEKVLLRPDGTSIYITQDIYLAKIKFEEYKLSESIYVVGNEQEYHFNVLFEILDKIGILTKDKLTHLSYGMVELPDGKMKSREGTIVDADNLIEEIQDAVLEAMKSRGEQQSKEKALAITLAAIKYFLLKVDAKKNMTFNPKESISFEGDTGPYLQYAYARSQSILRKQKPKELEQPSSLEEKETNLILKINECKHIYESAYTNMNPAIIANYTYKLAQTFNEFYHACPVIGSEKENFRLHLTKAFGQVLKNSLYLLGIQALKEM